MVSVLMNFGGGPVPVTFPGLKACCSVGVNGILTFPFRDVPAAFL